MLDLAGSGFGADLSGWSQGGWSSSRMHEGEGGSLANSSRYKKSLGEREYPQDQYWHSDQVGYWMVRKSHEAYFPHYWLSVWWSCLASSFTTQKGSNVDFLSFHGCVYKQVVDQTRDWLVKLDAWLSTWCPSEVYQLLDYISKEGSHFLRFSLVTYWSMHKMAKILQMIHSSAFFRKTKFGICFTAIYIFGYNW